MRFDRRRKLPIKSSVVKHSMIVNGRDSSVSIEGAFWNALKEIAVAQNISANALVSKIDRERDVSNLSSAIVCMLSNTIAAPRTRVPILSDRDDV
jgi:predicted DNA-binding ribbon-helix-helix protein